MLRTHPLCGQYLHITAHVYQLQGLCVLSLYIHARLPCTVDQDPVGDVYVRGVSQQLLIHRPIALCLFSQQLTVNVYCR